MRHVPPRRSPFLSPLSPNDPLVYALPPIYPIFCHSKTPNFWFVTQRPPILILSIKTHHFNLLAQTVISHNNWSQDFNGFIACGQLDVINISVNLWFERPIKMIFGLSPNDFLFSGCSQSASRSRFIHCKVIFSFYRTWVLHTVSEDFRNFPNGKAHFKSFSQKTSVRGNAVSYIVIWFIIFFKHSHQYKYILVL